MCGLLGRLSYAAPLPANGLGAALATLAHRGPDGQGFWRSACGRIELGHTLLSTVVEAGADQPITDAHGNTVVANAEFYGHETIRGWLTARGEALASRSDCAILAPLYRSFGAEMFSALRGEFAFVLWDPARQRLWAARDRFGIKPLYYAEIGNVFYVASEVKTLFALGVPARWDREALAIYQAAHLPAGRTLFAGVHSVPPGHYLEVTAEGIILHRYWAYPTAAETLADPVSTVREGLIEAIDLRRRSHVAVGTYLSGGLDSTSIVGIQRVLSDQRITALTVTFPGSELDETPTARASAAAIGGVELIEVRACEEALAVCFESAVLGSEAPCSNAHGAAKYMLSARAKAEGLTVVLTGEGADEIFWGYPHLTQAWVGSVPHWLADDDGDTALWRELYQPELAEFARSQSASRILRDNLAALEQGPTEGVAGSAWLWTRTVLPNYLLRTLGDGVEMANGIEGRQPFLDHHLAEAVIPLGEQWKLRGGHPKALLRMAVQSFVPPEVVRGSKRPFLSPPAKGALRGRLLALAAAHAGEIPAFDADAVMRIVKKLSTAGQDMDPMLFELAALGVLQKHFACS